jgi:uncharacterized protein YbdZ (MbtH family)
MTTDPTPAATARDALTTALVRTDNVGGWRGYEDWADRLLAALPAGWTLAAAAPGRVAALEAFIERVATMGFCSQTHHEHIVRDANRLLATPAPTPSEPVARS